MKFLGLLLGLVILVAILYQTVFTPTMKTQTKQKQDAKISQGMEAVKKAKELQKMINNQQSDYEKRLKEP